MKNYTIVFIIALLLSFCQEKKRIHSETYNTPPSLETKIEIQNLSPLLWGDTILFSIIAKEKYTSIDSVSASFQQKEIHILQKNDKWYLNSNQLKLGKYYIQIRIYLPENKKESHSLLLEIQSPVIPIKYTYEKINTYPHDASAYTQGLLIHDGYFYESTGLEGRSTLRKVDIKTGNVVQKKALTYEYFGEGLTLYKGNLIQLTWRSGIGFVYDKETFEQKETFRYSQEGWGLTTWDSVLIMSDGTENLYFLDPVSFAEKSRIQVYNKQGKVTELNELEMVDDKLYANIYTTDIIVIIDPKTGIVEGEIDMKGIMGNDTKKEMC